jgi:hypothetical protein
MATKFTRLTHKIATQLHLMAESCTFAVLTPGSQSGNFWIHVCIPNFKQQANPFVALDKPITKHFLKYQLNISQLVTSMHVLVHDCKKFENHYNKLLGPDAVRGSRVEMPPRKRCETDLEWIYWRMQAEVFSTEVGGTGGVRGRVFPLATRIARQHLARRNCT